MHPWNFGRLQTCPTRLLQHETVFRLPASRSLIVK